MRTGTWHSRSLDHRLAHRPPRMRSFMEVKQNVLRTHLAATAFVPASSTFGSLRRPGESRPPPIPKLHRGLFFPRQNDFHRPTGGQLTYSPVQEP